MPAKIKIGKIDPDKLRRKLKLKNLEAKDKFLKEFPDVEAKLREKGIDLEKIRDHSSKILTAGVLSGALFLSNPSTKDTLPTPNEFITEIKAEDINTEDVSSNKLLTDSISSIIPEKPRPLDRSEEKLLEQVFKNVVGVDTRATLEGEHLNTTYGYIGLEQHLRRYPGDTIENHGEGQILHEGMAPGLGAWGYFASSKEKLSPDLVETEKWYAVVQTLYLPDWNTRQPFLRDWYKYRKVLIVNTENGNAVVAAIADSGPAAWTGKQYGGSPEVMNYLGGPRYTKGKVLLFFVDDPENKVPLGPVDYSKLNLSQAFSLN